jgi:hypothetical protein
MKTQNAITLVRTRRGCAMCEAEDRYDVHLFGTFVSQIYFNLRGYVGGLPTPDGTTLSLPERGISFFQREAAKLNGEFAAAGFPKAQPALKETVG